MTVEHAPPPTAVPTSEPNDPPRAHLLPTVALALIVGVMAAIMFAGHRAGHWWGDDWALYIRQARALLDGDPSRVLRENQFTVENSLGGPFSPPLYPWGFPIILAPFVAVVGTDVDALAVAPVMCAAVFACCWYGLARPRIGTVPALVGTVAVTLTPQLLGWTELIQSEWPFMATAALALVILDRVVAIDSLVGPAVRLMPLIAVGLGTAAAFSVRREGLGMVAAVAAAQLAGLWAGGLTLWRLPVRPFFALLGRLLVPHVAALAAVLVLQVVMPTTVIPSYSGTSVANVWRFAGKHVHHLAEISGLQRPAATDPTVFGNVAMGWVAVTVYLVAAFAGAVLALTKYRVRDVHLLAYAVGAFVIGASFRSAINRYVCSVAPILLLLGLVAVTAAFRRFGRPGLATLVATLVVTALAVGNLSFARDRVESAGNDRAAGLIEWGPTHPAAIEMFDAVERLTSPDDIVASPKARAMVLETGRTSIQVDDYRPVPDDLDIAAIVVEPNSGLADELSSGARFGQAWANDRFQIFLRR